MGAAETRRGVFAAMSVTIQAHSAKVSAEIKAALLPGLEKRYTEPPEYDPDMQYITDHWEQDGQYAVQVWTVHDIPVSETVDD